MSKERQDRAARAEQMRREREKADKKQRNVISIAIVLVVIGLIVGGGLAVKNASDKNAKSTEYVAPKSTTKDYGIVYDTKIATGKAADNPVEVVLYEDFQCPACKAFEEGGGEYLNQAVTAGDITIDYRPVSFLEPPGAPDYSMRATNTAMCVLDTTDVKTFKAMHDILFIAQSPESGPGLTDQKLADLAEEAGVDTSLSTCINSMKFGPWIERATDRWKADGFTGTPTVLVDGKKVEGPKQANGQTTLPGPADIQKAIDAAKN